MFMVIQNIFMSDGGELHSQKKKKKKIMNKNKNTPKKKTHKCKVCVIQELNNSNQSFGESGSSTARLTDTSLFVMPV